MLGRAPTLSAPRPVLHEATLVAMDELADAIGRRCAELLRREATATTELRVAVEELLALLDLLDTLATPAAGGS